MVEWIEKLAITCDNYLGEQWSWICRGGEILARELGKNELADELNRLSAQLGFGVSAPESAELLKKGCPLDRAKLDWIVRQFKQVVGDEGFEMTSFQAWLQVSAGDLAEQPLSIYSRIRVSEDDLNSLKRFLQ